MAGRRTNLALLVLLAVTLATGGLSFAIGSGWGRWPVVAHGVAGLGILLLTPWKSVIARRGVRRRGPHSWASLAFAALAALAVASGVAHGTGAMRTVGGVTAMQIHVGAALTAIPLAVWHVAARRVRMRRTDLSRRALLRGAALTAGSVATYGALTAVTWTARLPGRGRRFTGSYERGSHRPEEMPVTQWLDDHVPSIDAADWRLAVLPIGSRPGRVAFLSELEADRRPVMALLDCTGGWYAEQRWEGVPVADLFDPTELRGARSVLVTSVTGYARRFPVRDVATTWVATRAGEEPLSPGHGFPARIVAPSRRGFWWVKWVVTLEASPVPWWWQPPFPVT